MFARSRRVTIQAPRATPHSPLAAGTSVLIAHCATSVQPVTESLPRVANRTKRHSSHRAQRASLRPLRPTRVHGVGEAEMAAIASSREPYLIPEFDQLLNREFHVGTAIPEQITGEFHGDPLPPLTSPFTEDRPDMLPHVRPCQLGHYLIPLPPCVLRCRGGT